VELILGGTGGKKFKLCEKFRLQLWSFNSFRGGNVYD
jgi:hypothetical protein